MMHGDAIIHAVTQGKVSRGDADRQLLDPENMGFVTKTGAYLTRREAAAHVLKTNQFRIQNPKDEQLVKLKARLERDLADPNGRDSHLDAFDVSFAKGLRPSFEELENIKDDEFHGLQVRVMHPNGQQGMDLHLIRMPHHPEGHWDLANVDPVDHTLSISGHPHSNAFANRLGPAIVRQTVRHLNEKYGITKVRGFRVSGARFAGQPDDREGIESRESKLISVTMKKALLKAELLEKYKESGVPGSFGHTMKFVMKTRHKVPVLVHAHRYKGHAKGEYRVDIGPENILHDRVEFDDMRHKNKVGVTRIRQVMRELKAHGVDTIESVRTSGARAAAGKPDNRIRKDLAKSSSELWQVKHQLAKALFDLKNVSKNPVPVKQEAVARTPFEKPSSFAKYDETVGRTMRAWNSAENKKRLEVGIKNRGHEWYHMDQLHQRFRERHGKQEGSRRFNLFMDTIAATSHNSEFSGNLRRAGALYPFMLHGDPKRKLSREEGLNHLLGPKLGNTAHREMASALQAVREGRSQISKDPLKIDGFAANLRGNHEPLTADRHVGRQSGHEGRTGLSIVYQGIEDATKHHASALAQRGDLPVAPGRSATAAFQSALWVGDAVSGRVKSASHPALVEFEREITSAAQKAGISPSKALDHFMDGKLLHFGGGAPGLHPHTALAMKKGIDYDALEDEFEPRPSKGGGKKEKGKPVGSRTDQARHAVSAFNATKKRVETLKDEGRL